MKTVKPEVLTYMMRQLEKYIITYSKDIPEWESVDGQYLGNGQFEHYEDTRTALKLGDTWDARYDCARIFTSQTVIPAQLSGKKLFLELDFGGEALVTINGKISGAVSSNMQAGWVHRDRIFIDKKGKSDLTLNIELDSCVNSGGFCDAAMDGAKSVTYTLKKARIVAVDEDCDYLYFKLKTAWDAMNVIKDDYIKAKVYEVIDNTVHMVDFDFDEDIVRQSIKEASEYFDSSLKKIPHTPQSRVLMEGHCHIDIAWLWRIQESERKAARTFSNNLELMDRYPDFRFAQSQAILYDMIKRLYPDLYERIKKQIKDKRWEVVGNVWVEADTNIASGESLIRQLLYGTEFFKKEFGVTSDIYWLPDCFGFSWALPQIIKRSGMKYFITAKINSQDTERFPHTLFKWKGVDGSEIVAYNQRVHYDGEYTPQYVMDAADRNEQKEVVSSAFGMYGYGDGGGGCTYEQVERGRFLSDFPGMPSSKPGTAKDFFKEVEKIKDSLPEFKDEIYYENHRGTYTSQAHIKKGCRKSEILLREAEISSALSEIFARTTYSEEELEELWKILLKNQFHDILPGTSIHEAMEDCRPDFDKVLKDTSVIKTSSLMNINSFIDIKKNGVLVWNLLPFEVSAPVTVELSKEAHIFGELDGIPQHIYNQNGRLYLSFMAKNVPAMGYKLFPISDSSATLPIVTAKTNLLENEKLRVVFDTNGLITSVYDKVNNREVLSGEGNLMTVFQDKCVHETAWNLELNYQKKGWDLRKADSVKVIEENELRGVIEIVRHFNKSTITQNVILYAGSDKIDFETDVDWHERDKVLKAAFPVDILANDASFEIAHGAIKRPNHWNRPHDMAMYEQCAHKWADMSEGDYGVSILNDCKYGYDIKDNVMRITLLRAPTCPDRTGDDGLHSFTYSLYPHKNPWQTGKTSQRARELNCPLIPFKVKAHPGQLTDRLSFISSNSDNISIEAFKKAQDGRGYILRIAETNQSRAMVNLRLAFPVAKITECNLMEEDETDIPVINDSFSFRLKPFQVKTFRLMQTD